MRLRIQKKPEFYRAIIFDGQNGIDVQEFCKEKLVTNPKANELVISTKGDDQLALPGYYIIEKSENNFFVLSPSEFKVQYNIIQQYPKITRL